MLREIVFLLTPGRCLFRLATRALLLSALFLGTGCEQPASQTAKSAPDNLVLMLPGVEGGSWQLTSVVDGLHDAGVRQEIEIIPWGKWPLSSMDNLMNHEANLERAKKISERIAAHRQTHPSSSITLVGYSGGGGIAVMVAEALPENVSIDRLILIAAAVSPEYDLTKVLSHVRGNMVNFYSENDWFMLGWGTQTFGTIDRKNTAAAGRIGFVDAAGKPRESQQIKQIEWRPDWARLGHWGGHIGWLARPWAREVLAAQLRAS
jgi:pimeloyl-ACP methyl ester carboxylesterase